MGKSTEFNDNESYMYDCNCGQKVKARQKNTSEQFFPLLKLKNAKIVYGYQPPLDLLTMIRNFYYF